MPTEHDELPGLSVVHIDTDDGRRFDVSDDGEGQELPDYLYESVAARGVFDESSGRRLFKVRYFEPLDVDDGFADFDGDMEDLEL